MPHPPIDPLLVAARGIVLVLLALSALAALAFALCLPLAAVSPELVLSFLLGRDIREVPPDTVGLLLGLVAAGLLTMLATACFLRQLLCIVGSVLGGDPFVPANARRLARMAWAALGIQLLAVPLVLLDRRLQETLPADQSILTLPFTGNGAILALVLFALARVFRRGAAMREDLEGTV